MYQRCDDCGKIFKRKSNLNYHLDKKVCIKLKKTCINCGHQFKNIKMLEYHIENKVCNKKEKPKIVVKKEILEKYRDYSKEELIITVANLEGQCQALKE